MEINNPILEKSINFGLKIVNLYKYLTEKNEFVLSKQILKSGTSIGANVVEAQRGFSHKEFLHKLNISLGEVSETRYWLYLLVKAQFIDEKMYTDIDKDCLELEKILTSILKK
ncbi:MAG: four helix bundle protein [Abditibacteriota bacterium]|nr:four helix bundle protein [Abditibacteriota bacterium]